jgi:hypothetical protein
MSIAMGDYAMTSTVSEHPRLARLNVVRCALTGAAVLIVLLIVCWATAAAGAPGAPHAFISLAASAKVSSLGALFEGVGWALGFGALTGALVAAFYNLFHFAGGRGH